MYKTRQCKRRNILTCRQNLVVALFNVVFPETFNDETKVVILFNVVFPETVNDELIFVALFNVAFPEIFKVDNIQNILYN